MLAEAHAHATFAAVQAGRVLRTMDSDVVAARESMLEFTTYTKPDYEVNWHHKVLCDHLDRFVAGEIKRLMVFMPQRQGKSELVSRRLPAYIFGRTPKASVMGCAYGSDLSSRMNRDVQRIIDSPEYLRAFPDTKLYGRNVRMTAQGVYLRNSDIFEIVDYLGVYRSAGVGGGITGMGFDFGIIDDPVKDPKDAESEVVRESLWEWYTGAFWTRQAPSARILLTMTRWHEDDLAGRLLELAKQDPKADQWTILKLPGICEDPTPAYEQRQVGEALWPARADIPYYEAMKANSIRQYESMCQQNPTAREGGMFTLTGLPTTNKEGVAYVAPAGAGIKRIRYWDLGGSDSNKADYSVGVLMSKTPENLFFVEDVERGQWSPNERNARIRATAEADQLRGGVDGHGQPLRPLTTWIEKVPGLAVEVIDNIVRLMAGLPVKTEMAKNDKKTRADPLADQCTAGNVRVVKADWNTAYRYELTAFPNGKNDDQVDASSGAFSKLAVPNFVEDEDAYSYGYREY